MVPDWPIKKVFIDQGLPSSFIPILTYHGVTSDTVPPSLASYTLSENQFEAQMRFLSEHGYSCMDLKDLFRPSGTEKARLKKSFILTFDDGFENFYTRAYPILRKYGFAATVFLITDLVGRGGNHDFEMGIPILSWEQVKSLRAEGFSFGSHTCSHARLTGLSQEQVRHELVASKECLMAELGQDDLLISYPYGESNSSIRKIAIEAGYLAAFGVNMGEPSRFNVWRNGVKSTDSMKAFNRKLTHWYTYYIRLFGWIRESTAMGRYLRKVKTSRRGM